MKKTTLEPKTLSVYSKMVALWYKEMFDKINQGKKVIGVNSKIYVSIEELDEDIKRQINNFTDVGILEKDIDLKEAIENIKTFTKKAH